VAKHLPKGKHFRVIHSIYPPKNLFDTVSNEDAFLLAELEGESSDRLMRWRECVSLDDARFGDGWGPVMASFCYIRPGRFNTASFGCYYAANSIHTAVKEWSFHAAGMWNEFNYREDANAMVRSYAGTIVEPLMDVRKNNRVHARNSYEASQQLGSKLRQQHEYGVLYRSVRDKGGLCFGFLRPPATSKVSQAAHYTVAWDGERFTEYAEVKPFRPL
jgi:hypothetical protein